MKKRNGKYISLSMKQIFFKFQFKLKEFSREVKNLRLFLTLILTSFNLI